KNKKLIIFFVVYLNIPAAPATSSLLTESQTSAPTTPSTTSSLSTEYQTSAPTTPTTTRSTSNESEISTSTSATSTTCSPSTEYQTSVPTSSPNTESNTSTGYVGIVLGVICFLFIITLILFFYSRRPTKNECPGIPIHTI
ncbi:hypothetical protein cypCar_00028319, partial [Cyprinus carpio]